MSQFQIELKVSKKRDITNLNVFVFSVLLIEQNMLGDSFIDLVIDLFGVIIESEQFFFHHIIVVFGASHDWSIVTSEVCCIYPFL